jgi:micrococcal nuclease|tara:strand:+ start:1377 stop:1742 length:366 start_codon:yes stop_codon:yes gene_type:complete
MPRKRGRPRKKNYIYKAEVQRVVDGDTFRIRVDLGFKTYRDEIIRLKDVDTPEIRGKERPEGLKVKAYVKKLIDKKTILLESFKRGRYGRYICEIYLSGKEKKDPLSKHLLKKGMAKKVNY